MDVVRTYFLAAVNSAQKAALNAKKIIYADFELEGEQGIILDETQLLNGLRALKKVVLAELPTKTDGVFKIMDADITGLDPEYAQGDDLKWYKNSSVVMGQKKKFLQTMFFENLKKKISKEETSSRVSGVVGTGSWNGEKQNEFYQLAKQILYPKIRTKIIISVPHSRNVNPVDDDNFHIHIWSAPPESGSNGTKTPATIWGTSVSCTDPSFKPSGRGLVITDEKTGYAVAELVNENTLYIFHDLCHYGSDSELLIFRKILEAVVAPKVFSQLKRFRRPAKKVEPKKKQRPEELNKIEIDKTIIMDLSGFTREESILAKRVYLPIVARELMAKIKRSVCLHNGRGEFREENLPHYDNMFHIYFFASPSESTRQEDFTPSRLWNIPLSARGGSLQVTGEGVAVYDDAGQEAGQIVAGRNLYIPYSLLGNKVEQKRIFEQLLRTVARLLTSTVAERQAQEAKLWSAQAQVYASVCLEHNEALVQDAKEELADVKKQVSGLQTQLVAAIRKLDGLKKVAEGKGADSSFHREKFATEFIKMRQLEKIRRVTCTPSQLIVDTDVLYCKHPKKKQTHLIGAFRIIIPFDGDCEEIRFYNLTQTINGHQAPHVFNDGEACLGSQMEEILPQLIARFDFMPLLIMCIIFLESVNINDDLGEDIESWPIVSEKK